MGQHVSLTFSLKYLVNFSKSASLSDTVQLMMSNDVPLLVIRQEHSLVVLYSFLRRSLTPLVKATSDTILLPRSGMTDPPGVVYCSLYADGPALRFAGHSHLFPSCTVV